MYESYFGLTERPFAPTPRADRYFPAASADAARQTLARCAERAEGTGLLIGPPGIGKSLLLYVLADQFRERFSVAVLCGGQLQTRRELLQAILFELQLPYESKDEGELRLALVDHLARGEHCPQGMLLLVDEAHALPTLLLEELRMITNLVRHGEPQVRLALAGGMPLEEKLADPALEALSQRLTARCYLDAFDRAETMDYVRFQVAVAGGQAEDLFDDSALEAVHQATGGVPRLVNQVCDHALLLGCQTDQRPITSESIQEAWADLQQLPAPWQGAPAVTSEGVVEFGGLDDEEPVPDEPALDDAPSTEDASSDLPGGPEWALQRDDDAAAIDAADLQESSGDDSLAGERTLAPANLDAGDDDVMEELTVNEPADEQQFGAAADPLDPEQFAVEPLEEEPLDEHAAVAPDAGQTIREAETALDRIQQHVEALGEEVAALSPADDDDEQAADDEPAEPEHTFDADVAWTLSFEDFDEEEVLFDPYAQLDSQQQTAPAAAPPVSPIPVVEQDADSPQNASPRQDREPEARPPQSETPTVPPTAAARPEHVAEVGAADETDESAHDVQWNVASEQLEVVVDPYAGLRDTDHHPSAMAAGQAADASSTSAHELEGESHRQTEDKLEAEVNDIEVNDIEGDDIEGDDIEVHGVVSAEPVADVALDRLQDADGAAVGESAADERPTDQSDQNAVGGEDIQSTIPLSEVIRIRHDAEFADNSSPQDDAASESPTAGTQSRQHLATPAAERHDQGDDTNLTEGPSCEVSSDDLIVLEDSGEPGQAPSPPRVERQDYRRLFARLRNG